MSSENVKKSLGSENQIQGDELKEAQKKNDFWLDGNTSMKQLRCVVCFESVDQGESLIRQQQLSTKVCEKMYKLFCSELISIDDLSKTRPIFDFSRECFPFCRKCQNVLIAGVKICEQMKILTADLENKMRGLRKKVWESNSANFRWTDHKTALIRVQAKRRCTKIGPDSTEVELSQHILENVFEENPGNKSKIQVVLNRIGDNNEDSRPLTETEVSDPNTALVPYTGNSNSKSIPVNELDHSYNQSRALMPVPKVPEVVPRRMVISSMIPGFPRTFPPAGLDLGPPNVWASATAAERRARVAKALADERNKAVAAGKRPYQPHPMAAIEANGHQRKAIMAPPGSPQRRGLVTPPSSPSPERRALMASTPSPERRLNMANSQRPITSPSPERRGPQFSSGVQKRFTDAASTQERRTMQPITRPEKSPVTIVTTASGNTFTITSVSPNSKVNRPAAATTSPGKAITITTISPGKMPTVYTTVNSTPSVTITATTSPRGKMTGPVPNSTASTENGAISLQPSQRPRRPPRRYSDHEDDVPHSPQRRSTENYSGGRQNDSSYSAVMIRSGDVETVLEESENEVNLTPSKRMGRPIQYGSPKRGRKPKTHVSNSKNRQCPQCKKVFKTNAGLNGHVWIHNRPYCGLCRQYYLSQDEMNHHQNEFHSSSIYDCRFCDKSYPYRDGLLHHVRQHNDMPTYGCAFCDFKFKLRAEVKEHMKAHDLGNEGESTTLFIDSSQSNEGHFLPEDIDDITDEEYDEEDDEPQPGRSNFSNQGGFEGEGMNVYREVGSESEDEEEGMEEEMDEEEGMEEESEDEEFEGEEEDAGIPYGNYPHLTFSEEEGMAEISSQSVTTVSTLTLTTSRSSRGIADDADEFTRRALAFGKQNSTRKIMYRTNHQTHYRRPIETSPGVSKILKRTLANGTVEYICEVCGFADNTRSKVRCHQRNHPMKMVECHVCYRRFKRRDNLNVHLKSHANQTIPLSCHICNSTFASPKNLEAHLLHHEASMVENEEEEEVVPPTVVTKQVRFQCRFCPKFFGNYQAFMAHVRLHKESKNQRKKGYFPCHQCEKVFTYACNRARHNRTNHPRTLQNRGSAKSFVSARQK